MGLDLVFSLAVLAFWMWFCARTDWALPMKAAAIIAFIGCGLVEGRFVVWAFVCWAIALALVALGARSTRR